MYTYSSTGRKDGTNAFSNEKSSHVTVEERVSGLENSQSSPGTRHLTVSKTSLCLLMRSIGKPVLLLIIE